MIYTNEVIKKKKDNKIKRKKALKIILFPFVIFIILIACYVGYFKYLKNESNIDLFGYREYVVLTGSMEPNYNIGDLIIGKKVKQEDIKVNDVITYTMENGVDTVTHRVIEIVKKDGQTLYRTKGDNNNTADKKLVNYNQIQGRVVFKLSKIGTIITRFIEGTGVIFLVILIAFSYLHSSKKEENRLERAKARKLYNMPKYEKKESI